MSTNTIQDLANQIIALSTAEDATALLIKSRELHEQIVIFHHEKISKITTQTIIEKPELIKNEKIDVIEKNEVAIFVEEKENKTLANDKLEMSVQERIQQIMQEAKMHNQTTKEEEYKIPQPVINQQTPVKKESIFIKEEITSNDSLKNSLEEEFKDAISADYAADLFEKAEKIEITKKSLNDRLSQKQIQIGLNDRIAFVKHLFDGSQVDFNRVLSQLNSFQSEEQAKSFINTMVKTEYNWNDKTAYEDRLISLIERKFL